MMNVKPKEIILLYITIVGIMSYMPQIFKMIKTKRSDDLSVWTWVIWTVNSSLYLLYLILERVGFWLLLSQTFEVTLITTTLIVILIFRKSKNIKNKK